MQLNTGRVAGSYGKDLNVEPAWMQGITGKGVVVSVFDDGMTFTIIKTIDVKSECLENCLSKLLL